MVEVDEEIKKEMEVGWKINDEEMFYVIYKKLKSKGVVFK